MDLTPRERVLKTLRRAVPDRVPREFSLCPHLLDIFRKKTGADSPEAYFDFEVRRIRKSILTADPDLKEYFKGCTDMDAMDEWGIRWKKGSQFHFQSMVHPMAEIEDHRKIEDYPFPVVEENAFQDIAKQVEVIQKEGYAVLGNVAPLGGTVFWPAYKLRGMEALLTDMLVNPELACFLLDKVTGISCRMAEVMARSGVDILWLADDFGTQRDLMMSPSMWRTWFKSRLAQVADAARKIHPRIIIALHSDGNIRTIIPNLIEIGIEVLNPVQPECMDPLEIKREFGKNLAFWGTIGTQTTMPFGTPAEVRQKVKEMIETVGKGGGLLISPTHLLEPETPWENVTAFLDAVEEFGRYG